MRNFEPADNFFKVINITANVSGAVKAAQRGNIVVIIDIIDMSTTAEAAREAGAIKIFGASPDDASPPVHVNPAKIAYSAGAFASKYNTEVVIITEPRVGLQAERRKKVKQVKLGLKRVGASLEEIIPNIGAEVKELADLRDKVVILVTETGGVAFDAAYNYGAAEVITGTIARTVAKEGVQPAKEAANRAVKLANQYSTGISLVAASSNSYEDILAAEKIGELIIDSGFLQLKE